MFTSGNSKVAAATLAACCLVCSIGSAAGASGHRYASAHPMSCWRQSSKTGRWVNFCGTHWYQQAGPSTAPLFPSFGSGYYLYEFQYAPGANGPYYGYQPYNGGYESALGLSF